MQGVSDQLADVLKPEIAQLQLLDVALGAAEGIDRNLQWMPFVDFVVAIGTDHQHATLALVLDQMFDQA